MGIPEDGSEYNWSADPELKEVRKLNQFEYGQKFMLVRLSCLPVQPASPLRRGLRWRHVANTVGKRPAEQGEHEGAPTDDSKYKAGEEYFLAEAEHLHTADEMLFCVAGSAFVDVRHHLGTRTAHPALRLARCVGGPLTRCVRLLCIAARSGQRVGARTPEGGRHAARGRGVLPPLHAGRG